jgi:small subunit ribosomal protein S8e
MAEWHLKSKRKKTGGKRKSAERCDKKLAWKGGYAAHTIISKKDKDEAREKRTLGGNTKRKVVEAIHANVAMPAEKKNIKAQIITVEENSANREFARRNVITKGAIIKVKAEGKEITAKVSSRPGQDGTVNAIAVEKTAA